VLKAFEFFVQILRRYQSRFLGFAITQGDGHGCLRSHAELSFAV